MQKESIVALNFRELQYGRCDLLVVTDVNGNGVIIPKTKFLGPKFVPILVNKNNISEFSPAWTGLRKALFADSKISDFKKWLTDSLVGTREIDSEDVDAVAELKCPPANIGNIQYNELESLTIREGATFDPAVFSEYFFTDQKHTSSAQYRGEKHTAEKLFPTARGSAWLFQVLRAEGYGIEISSFNFG
jgi:hypothetical protein